MKQLGSVVVVGCGGIGCYLIPPLSAILGEIWGDNVSLTLIDGDTVSERNLVRQPLFSPESVGSNKTIVIKNTIEMRIAPIQVKAIPNFLGNVLLPNNTVTVFCSADNHGTRNRCLEEADRVGCWCFIGANEDKQAEAYCYSPEWKGTDKDPRTYYPELTEKDVYDPSLAIHCEDHSYQSAVSNNLAAAYMLQLYRSMFSTGGDRTIMEIELPYRINSTLHTIQTTPTYIGDTYVTTD